MVTGDALFAATGVTNGSILSGIEKLIVEYGHIQLLCDLLQKPFVGLRLIIKI